MPVSQVNELMRELESLGTEQYRKTYRRHGVTGEQFGVSFAHLRRLAKRIGTDQELALELWRSGNHDARVLATLIADPRRTARHTLESWVAEMSNYVESDLLASFVGRTPHALDAIATWTASGEDLVSATGWSTLGQLALGEEEVHDDLFLAYLTAIEIELGSSPNRTRHAMNGALIAIGCRNERLRAAARPVAERIGRVEVDHGQTDCRTPEAVPYIEKTWAHRAAKGSGHARRGDGRQDATSDGGGASRV